MTAIDILKTAQETLTQRGKDYDGPEGERSMKDTVTAFNAITGHNLSEQDGWQFMITLKQVRLANGGPLDCCVDIAGYGALAGETVQEDNPKW